MQDEQQADKFPNGRRKKKWTGWKPKKDAQKIDFRKKVIEKGNDKIDEDWASMQKIIEIAAGRVAHHSKT